MTKSNITDKFKEALSQVEVDYGVPVEHPMARTVAALKCLGFRIWLFGEDGNTGGKIACGPYIVLRSKEERIFTEYNEDDQISTDFDARNEELEIVNVRDKARLIDLLGEFYTQHNAPFGVRLIVGDLGSRSWLKSQASDVMALPENESYRDEWIKQSRVEMQAFTDFLIARS